MVMVQLGRQVGVGGVMDFMERTLFVFNLTEMWYFMINGAAPVLLQTQTG